MKAGRYKLYIDGKLAYSGNRIPYLKEKAQFEFDYCKSFYAEIRVGSKIYASRRYNTNWK